MAVSIRFRNQLATHPQWYFSYHLPATPARKYQGDFWMTVEPQDLGWCLYYDKSSSSFWEGFLALVLYLPCQFSLFLPKILCQPPFFFVIRKPLTILGHIDHWNHFHQGTMVALSWSSGGQSTPTGFVITCTVVKNHPLEELRWGNGKAGLRNKKKEVSREFKETS